ncbi:MAG: Tail-specific protease, partial [Chlamydiae bacterium]|nr:Tail-specific protease [Chlamydiota bacterium]
MRNAIKAFVLFLILPFSLAASHATLTSTDVRKVMNQFFEYHVDQKEMTSLLIERTLKIYIEDFDSHQTYLLDSEIKTYLHPDKKTLQSVLSDYQRDHFSIYFNLNSVIQTSIARSRQWRQEWSQDPLKLVAEAKAVTERSSSSDKSFAKSESDLRQKHHDHFVRFIAFQLEQQPRTLDPGKEGALVALCEKQFSTIENPYLGLGDQGELLKAEAQEHQVYLRMLKAMAHSLDAHTAYYSPEEAMAMKVQLEKGMCGLGVVLHEGLEGVVIADILKGGPVEKEGSLTKGDIIVEIDGKLIKSYSFAKVLDVLRGGVGSKTVLGVLSGEEQTFHSVQLTRAMITIEDKRVDISSEPFGDGVIGKLTLYSFYEGADGVTSEKDLQKAIDQLKAEGPLHGLVLDMRENSGGFLSQAVRVAGLFISSGVVVISKYSNDVMKYYRAVDGSRQFEGPLVVLISKGSASATEIVAQCLQDYGIAVVAGDTQTYGKGTIQHQTVTNDKTSSFFKVTIGRYYSVSGKSTQIDGVRSDIVVPTALNFEKVGEGYQDFPLSSDRVAPAFDDPLTDVDPYVKRWFSKFYLPALQAKVTTWEPMIPTLQANSQKRLDQNTNFEIFLKKIKHEDDPKAKASHGMNDLQMDEAVNIVKDMIFFLLF